MTDPTKATMTCSEDVDRFLKKCGGVKNILWSPKLDGVRCWAVVYADDHVEYLSRQKKRFDNFGCFDAGLNRLTAQMLKQGVVVEGFPVIFDGEVTAEGFSKVMTQLRRHKDVDNSIFRFAIFDYLGGGDISFVRRINNLYSSFCKIGGNVVYVLQHYAFPAEDATAENVIRLRDRMVKIGYEGIVLKTANGKYEHKRSGQWCKAKPTHTMEVRVVGIEMGEGKHEGKVGALACVYDGGTVSVGGGYSDVERVEFLTDTPKIIEVEYQELTADSMRFPRFVRVREDKDLAEVVNG